MSEEYKCSYCGKEFENQNQLNGHNMRCTARIEAKESQSERTDRTERIPFGEQKKSLDNFKRDGFVYRRFNDNWRHDPDRIRRAKLAGFEIVDLEQTGKPVGSNEDGSAIKGVIMRIPEQFYNEDQAAKLSKTMTVDDQIRVGKYLEQPGDKRYLPSGKIQMESKFTP